MNQYYLLLIEEAKKSPCVRRKYAAGFFLFPNNLPWEGHYLAHNKRVTSCCDTECVRDRFSITHGMNTDIGAEVHAEQVLLLHSDRRNRLFMVVGLDRNGNVLNGFQSWPCYSCARMLVEAGIRSVWVPEEKEVFKSYTLAEILEHYEQETFYALGDK